MTYLLIHCLLIEMFSQHELRQHTFPECLIAIVNGSSKFFWWYPNYSTLNIITNVLLLVILVNEFMFEFEGLKFIIII
jgi:hypothetical protein